MRFVVIHFLKSDSVRLELCRCVYFQYDHDLYGNRIDINAN